MEVAIHCVIYNSKKIIECTLLFELDEFYNKYPTFAINANTLSSKYS